MILLSKDHHITEREKMEFQPFGMEPDGTPIRDIAGLVTRANLDNLEDLISRKHGEEAGTQAVQELIRRLNERIPDPAYHVTTKFLKNPWNSYSTEFQAYMGRFCTDISEDPDFHFKMGRDKAITTIIQVLGRPFSVHQIYRMSAYFSQRFSRDLFYTEALQVSESSAIIQMRFSHRALRQFGPYMRSCAEMYCAGHKGYFTAVPERFHSLPQATVKDRQCLAEGDDHCEWSVTWMTRRSRIWGFPSAKHGDPMAAQLPKMPPPSRISISGPNPTKHSSMPATDQIERTMLLSKDHPITERARMKFQPFGKGPDGRTIHDLSGIVIKAAVEHLEDVMTRKGGPDAGKSAIEELVRRLNSRIPDPAYHVTAELLKNPWNGYSCEFSAFNGQFTLDISGDRRFNFNMAREKAISHIIQVLGRPFSVAQIYKMSAYFSQRYAKDAFLVDAVSIAERQGILRMTFSERMCQHFGEYRRACAYLWCDAVRGYFTGVPERFHNLPPATVEDRRCIAEGDDYCEWEVRWSEGGRRFWSFGDWTRARSVGHRAGTATAHSGPVPAAVPDANAIPRNLLDLQETPPQEPRSKTFGLVEPLARRILRDEIERREQLVEEQVRTLDSRHVELQESYVQQQQIAAELQRRVVQLTTLHDAGLVFASILDREALIETVLQTVTQKLLYDRAMLKFFDPDRKVTFDARILGVPPEIAEFARKADVPVTEDDSIESKVFLQGEPVLVGDVQQVLDRLHPLHQQLARMTQAKSFISVPLKVKNKVLGSLTVDRTREHSLTQDDLNVMVTLASQVAVSLDNALTYQQIEQLTQTLEQRVQERTQALQNANTRLQELDRMKSEFFANVSHEFRTPLTLSLGALNTLLKMSPTVKAKEQVHAGLRNTSRLLFLINELLDLAKCDSGLAELKKRCIDLAALVRDVAANFESGERPRINFRGTNEPIPIEVDPHQIKKVLYNLLSNAFKFSDPDNGQVWIRLGSKGEGIELEVEDNGIGIPRDQLDRIFDRFTQVEGSATRRYEGSGIGLALAKEIVTAHGGKITVVSELGSGATFTIWLPRGAASPDALVAVEDEESSIFSVLEETPRERIRSAASTPSAGVHRPLLLVVDDNADMRWYLERLFRGQYRVVLAQDGVEGLEQAKACRPDLIITDVMMPRMSGHDLLKAVREEDTLRSIPVIFLTARAGTEAHVESLQAGADDYVAKPFDESEILARVNNLIRLRAQERELMELQKEKLTRFMPPQLAEVILSDHDEVLKSHRAEITVAFIDLRGFTAFAETAEPEDVLGVLQEYQSEMGQLIADHHGMIERFSGDAIMIFFNDPIPAPNHAEQAIRLAIAMRDRIGKLKQKWSERGIDLGAGIGVATGFATLGMIGFEKRKDYAAIGAVTNLAARLCVEARHGQILISAGVLHLVKDIVRTESVGNLMLKGFQKAVPAYNVTGLAEQRPMREKEQTKKSRRD